MKVKVYLTILSDKVAFGCSPEVLFKDPRTYLTYNSGEMFVEERFVDLPDDYEVAETKMHSTILFKNDEACTVLLSSGKESIRVLDPHVDGTHLGNFKTFKLLDTTE